MGEGEILTTDQSSNWAMLVHISIPIWTKNVKTLRNILDAIAWTGIAKRRLKGNWERLIILSPEIG